MDLILTSIYNQQGLSMDTTLLITTLGATMDLLLASAAFAGVMLAFAVFYLFAAIFHK